METFSALLAICAGNSPVNSAHKGQWRGALMFSLICVWINGWVNNREAGDLRRCRSHYDVTVMKFNSVTHWGRVTHLCVSKLTITGSDNGLSPGRRQAIIWTNAGILFIGHSGTNFRLILIKIHTFSYRKIHLKVSFEKWRPFCLGLNELETPCGFNLPWSPWPRIKSWYSPHGMTHSHFSSFGNIHFVSDKK